jgi:hypothetical protein
MRKGGSFHKRLFHSFRERVSRRTHHWSLILITKHHLPSLTHLPFTITQWSTMEISVFSHRSLLDEPTIEWTRWWWSVKINSIIIITLKSVCSLWQRVGDEMVRSRVTTLPKNLLICEKKNDVSRSCITDESCALLLMTAWIRFISLELWIGRHPSHHCSLWVIMRLLRIRVLAGFTLSM